jgi:ABC-2 type transport system permease protein
MVVKMLVVRQIKESFISGIKNFSEFKLNLVLNLITDFSILFLLGYLIYYYTGNKNYLIYYLIILMIPSHVSFDLDRLIKTGDLDKYLVFPINFFIINFAKIFGQNLLPFLIKVSILFLVSYFYQINIDWLLFFICYPFAFLFASLFSFVIEVFAFFVYDYTWLYRILTLISMFFKGRLVPIDFFPEALKIITVYSFFSLSEYYLYLSAIGKLNTLNIFIYIFWLVVFAILSSYLWKKGLKYYEGQFN